MLCFVLHGYNTYPPFYTMSSNKLPDQTVVLEHQIAGHRHEHGLYTGATIFQRK